MTTAHETLHEVNDLGRQLRTAIPEVYAGSIWAPRAFAAFREFACDNAG